MAISSGELIYYRSYGFTGSPIQPDTDPSSSPLTTNKGGNLTATALSGTLNEFLRAAKGTDTQTADFYDYNKIYFRNTNSADNFLNGGLYISSKSSYADDTMSYAIGLTDGAYTINNSGTGEMSGGREDYDEETDGSTPINSPYPRVTGAGNEAATLYSTYSFDPSQRTLAVVDRNWRLSYPATFVTACYVKLVGLTAAGTIVVGYADCTSDGGTTPLTGSGTVTFTDYRQSTHGSAAAIDLCRPLYASVHLWTYEDESYGGGATTSNVNVGAMVGAEGDLYFLEHATVDQDYPIQENYDGAGTWQTKATIAGGTTGATVGQVFVPAFYPETYMDAVGEALLFPTLHATATPTDGFDQNEFGEQYTDRIAIWVRRKLDQTAAAAASVPNQIMVFGDSS